LNVFLRKPEAEDKHTISVGIHVALRKSHGAMPNSRFAFPRNRQVMKLNVGFKAPIKTGYIVLELEKREVSQRSICPRESWK